MEGIVVRRVIPSDNSCLFNAVGYVMDHDQNKASELRQIIAATVASDPEKYSEAFLGKPNAEYYNWILDSEKWGGAIELSILADYYGREIAAYDIQTTRCDLYGQMFSQSSASVGGAGSDNGSASGSGTASSASLTSKYATEIAILEVVSLSLDEPNLEVVLFSDDGQGNDEIETVGV